MKIALLSALLLFVMSTQAQNQLGFFAGPQASKTRYLILNQEQKNELRYGFQAGVNLKVPFDGPLSFVPTFFYSMKGYQVTFTEHAFPPDTAAMNNQTRIHTFEVAPLLQIDFSTRPGHFFIKGGPSIDFQLFGKEKYTLRSGAVVNRNMKFSFGDYGHFGANALAIFGYETVDGFSVFAQYTHGLASINNADGGPSIRHRVFGISVGKYFSRKKIVIDTRNKE